MAASGKPEMRLDFIKAIAEANHLQNNQIAQDNCGLFGYGGERLLVVGRDNSLLPGTGMRCLVECQAPPINSYRRLYL